MAKRGKRYRQAEEAVNKAGGPFTLGQASELLKQMPKAKFNESVDMDLRLGVDPRHADQMVRGSVALPHGTGKEVRVLVLADEGKQAEAQAAGADYVGLDDYIEKIQNESWVLGPRGEAAQNETALVAISRDVLNDFEAEPALRGLPPRRPSSEPGRVAFSSSPRSVARLASWWCSRST